MFARFPSALFVLVLALGALCLGGSLPTNSFNRTVPRHLFYELEELSRLTAIAYCVGSTGIQKPFQCLSHCSDFDNFELVMTWSTGILESSTCGYIALSHPPSPKRIIVAFRGTQSLSDALHDLMTSPATYVPYSLSNDTDCADCAVHLGFMASWNSTKALVLPTLAALIATHPSYVLTLTGHSLGGAVAGLAALEFEARGWRPRVATFGEPRFGNAALARYVDRAFPWNGSEAEAGRYARVTHAGDPVPLLPFEEWGWRMHGGETFISKAGLPPEVADLERCEGDADPACIQGQNDSLWVAEGTRRADGGLLVQDAGSQRQFLPGVPASWKIWQLLFAHRQYFWRLGLCFDPEWRDYPRPDDPPRVF